jgi:hypothetical protein
MESNAVVLNNLSEWLLFNANSAIFQLYHGENDIFIEDDEIRFVLDQHAELDLYSTSSLKLEAQCWSICKNLLLWNRFAKWTENW